MDGEQQVDTQDSDDDFNVGFQGTEVNAAPTETPAPAAEVPAGDDTPVQSAEPAQAEAAPAEQPTVQITQEMFDRLTKAADTVDTLTRRQDQVFGKLGAFEQVLARLQAETPDGEAVQVSESDFEDLAKEFPDLAALQIKGLNKVLGKLRGTGGQQQPIDIDERVSKTVDSIRRQDAIDAVEEDYPDWRDTVASTDFKAWLQTMPQEYQRKLNNSWNPVVVSRGLAQFKDFKSKQAEQPQKTEVASPAAPQTSSRKEIIQAAVAPKGTGGQPPAPTGDDEFDAGFRRYAPT